MSTLARARRELDAAWRSYVADGRLPTTLRPEIRRSWQRVKGEWSVDPGIRVCPGAVRDGDERSGSGEALEAAAPMLKQFADRLAPDGHVVALFDRAGVMLAVDGNPLTRDRLEAVNFAPGACWAERSAGTNAIGTALVEARPVEVFASEHFVEAWQPWTCASVPVRSAGEVIGVVDITSPWIAHNPGLLPTAEALALAIEHRLDALAAGRRERALREGARDVALVREELLAVVSHELRTPLTPLQLKIQVLQRLLDEDEGAVTCERLREALGGADRHLRRVTGFIDELLEASLGAARLTPSPSRVDLGALAHRVVEEQRAELRRLGCECVVTELAPAVGRWDATLVERALRHLLANAAKYAPGRIDVEVDLRTADGRATASLAVRDRGSGIAPEDCERIFLRFERAVSYRNVSGLGVGLDLVRRVAEGHGGAARVEEAPGGGSRFELTLPVA